MPEVKKQTLKLHLIPLSPEFQVRTDGIDPFHVSQMAEVYREWRADGGECPIPPPVLFKIGNVYKVTDGNHRIDAMRAAGVEEAEFEVHVGVTVSDAAKYASQSGLGHTMLKWKKPDLRRALLMFYDNEKDAKLTSDSVLARKYKIDRRTVKAWLEEHDAERKEQVDRTDKNGNLKKTDAGKKKAKPEADLGTLLDNQTQATGESTPDTDDRTCTIVQVDSAEATPPSPEIPVRGDGEYPPDRRIMPNAAEAEKISTTLSVLKSALERVRAEMRKLLPDPQHPIANRLNVHTTFVPNLSAMLEDITNNSPTHVCPRCAGQTEVDGVKCRECSAYGLVSAGDADEMKSLWKKGSGDLYDRLVRQADLSEVEA